jgi:hypothetical protein
MLTLRRDRSNKRGGRRDRSNKSGLKVPWRFFKSQRGIKLSRQSLGEPWIKKLVAAPNGDRARPNHRDNLALMNPNEKIEPKVIVQFCNHQPRGQTRICNKISVTT